MSNCFEFSEPFAKILFGLRWIQKITDIYCFIQPGTAQAKACCYILQKALRFSVFCFFILVPKLGLGTHLPAKLGFAKWCAIRTLQISIYITR